MAKEINAFSVFVETLSSDEADVMFIFISLFSSPGPDYQLCQLYHGRAPSRRQGGPRSAVKFLRRCF